jgi:aminoglycoside phosphotransferase (APT) family kinase protein
LSAHRRAQTADSEDRLAPPGWLREALGPGLRAPRRLRWGFSHETWAASVADRVLVATRMDDAQTAQAIVDRGPELARRLAAAGVPSPAPDPGASRPELGIVVAEYVEGSPGIEAMVDVSGVRRVGAAAGAAWARLASVDPVGLGLDDLWTRPADLRASALEWLHLVEAEVPARQAAALRERVTAIESLLEGRRAGLVHGDLVPVNMLMHDGALRALLDLEAAHVGEPLLDAAWFSWIVGYHHPEVEPAASGAFAREAGLMRTDDRTAALWAALPSIRILEILARLPARARARGHWLGQLCASTER